MNMALYFCVIIAVVRMDTRIKITDRIVQKRLLLFIAASDK